MPTVEIDGQEVTVDRGTTILQAAERVGVDVPTFCYHPGLSRPANCRMCLVSIEGPRGPAPKPVPACYTEVSDGMKVFTQSDRVKKIRKSILEFILVNHPVDCPICDQAGECVLQDHYFKYSAQPSRLFMRKVHKPKAKVLGPDVILDAERCILCTRCIRFCDEIAKQSQLEIVNRGEHSEITTFPGKQLDNPYAGNTVDICPVGALTSRDFRFKTRVWFLQSAESVCPECSRGCKVRVDTFENVVRRYKPLHNPNVNDWWMCDKGRLSYKNYLEDRMEGPAMTVDGRRVATDVLRATEAAAELVSDTKTRDIAVIASPWMSNEDAFLLGKLLTGKLAGAKVFLGGRADGDADDILVRADKNPNRRGVTEVFSALGVKAEPLAKFDGDCELALVFGDEHALTEAQSEALAETDTIVLGAFINDLWRESTVYLPTRLHWEKDGSFTSEDGVVQRLNRAVRAASTCKSDGWYAMRLAQLLGQDLDYSSPLAIFSALTREVPAFAGMTYQKLSPHGVKLGEGQDAPAEASPASAPTAQPEA